MLDIVNQGRRVQERLKALARLNIELAKVEGKQKATFLGIAVGLGVAAALLVLYALGFIFAAAAAALDEALSLWLALLVVAIVLLGGAAVAGYVAVRFAKKLEPPVQAIDEAKQTVATVKSHV
jgi:hypothetical protein